MASSSSPLSNGTLFSTTTVQKKVKNKGPVMDLDLFAFNFAIDQQHHYNSIVASSVQAVGLQSTFSFYAYLNDIVDFKRFHLDYYANGFPIVALL